MGRIELYLSRASRTGRHTKAEMGLPGKYSLCFRSVRSSMQCMGYREEHFNNPRTGYAGYHTWSPWEPSDLWNRCTNAWEAWTKQSEQLSAIEKQFLRIPHTQWGDTGCWLSVLRMCAKLLSHVPLFVTPSTVSPPDSSVSGIFQARILEWFALSSSRGSSCVSCIGKRVLYH